MILFNWRFNLKSIYCVAVMLMICSLTCVQNVEAFGLGISGGYGAGKAEHTYKQATTYGGDVKYNYDTERMSIGVVMDTNLSKDKLFNYRLGLSYEAEDFERTGFKYRAHGGCIENDFGFGIIRDDSIRLWIGPELRISYFEKDWGNGVKTSLAEVGMGPVVGLNININPGITLAAKAGYMIIGTGGTIKQPTSTIYGSSVQEKDIEGTGNYPILNFALIFRIGE